MKRSLNVCSINTARALKRLRLTFGLSQAELAEKINVSTSAVKQWEQARCMPSPKHYAALLTLIEDTYHDEADTIYDMMYAAQQQDFNNRILKSFPAEMTAEIMTAEGAQ